MEDEDTIELVLTPQEMAALMHAAAAEPEQPAPELIPPATPPTPTRTRFLPVQLRAIRVPAIVTLTVCALSLSGMKYAAISREQQIPLAPTPSPVVAQTPAVPPPDLSTPAEPPVRFTNPFDASEVFDFPAGTSEDEARAAVATILLDRARTRMPSR